MRLVNAELGKSATSRLYPNSQYSIRAIVPKHVTLNIHLLHKIEIRTGLSLLQGPITSDMRTEDKTRHPCLGMPCSSANYGAVIFLALWVDRGVGQKVDSQM